MAAKPKTPAAAPTKLSHPADPLLDEIIRVAEGVAPGTLALTLRQLAEKAKDLLK